MYKRQGEYIEPDTEDDRKEDVKKELATFVKVNDVHSTGDREYTELDPDFVVATLNGEDKDAVGEGDGVEDDTVEELLSTEQNTSLAEIRDAEEFDDENTDVSEENGSRKSHKTDGPRMENFKIRDVRVIVEDIGKNFKEDIDKAGECSTKHMARMMMRRVTIGIRKKGRT